MLGSHRAFVVFTRRWGGETGRWYRGRDLDEGEVGTRAFLSVSTEAFGVQMRLWQIAAGRAGMRVFLSELEFDEEPDFIGVKCVLTGYCRGCD